MQKWSQSPVKKLSSSVQNFKIDIKNILLAKSKEDEIKTFDNISDMSPLKNIIKSWPEDAKKIYVNMNLSRKDFYHEGYNSSFKIETKTTRFGTTKNLTINREIIQYGDLNITACGCFDRAIEYDALAEYEWPIFKELGIPRRPYYLSMQETEKNAEMIYDFIRKKTLRGIFKRWGSSLSKTSVKP